MLSNAPFPYISLKIKLEMVYISLRPQTLNTSGLSLNVWGHVYVTFASIPTRPRLDGTSGCSVVFPRLHT